MPTSSPDTIWTHRSRGRWIAITGTGEQRRNRSAVLADGPARDAACRHTALETVHGTWLDTLHSADPFARPLHVREPEQLLIVIDDGDTAASLRTVAHWARDHDATLAIDERDPLTAALEAACLDDVDLIVCAAPR